MPGTRDKDQMCISYTTGTLAPSIVTIVEEGLSHGLHELLVSGPPVQIHPQLILLAKAVLTSASCSHILKLLLSLFGTTSDPSQPQPVDVDLGGRERGGRGEGPAARRLPELAAVPHTWDPEAQTQQHCQVRAAFNSKPVCSLTLEKKMCCTWVFKTTQPPLCKER